MMRSSLNVFQHPRVPISYALFFGELPTRRQLNEIKERELGISFRQLPDEYLDLNSLVRDAPFLRHLSVIDGLCNDANPLVHLPELLSLELTIDQRTDVDLSSFNALERFWGDHKHFESAAGCKTLKSLALQGTNGRSVAEIQGPLEYLELIDAKALKRLPLMSHPSSLKQLWVLGSARLSLTGLGAYSALETLTLQSCKELTDVDELAKVESLAVLGLVKCASVEPQDSLLALQGISISVVDRNPFDDAFRAKARSSESQWTYHGTAVGRKVPEITD